MLNFAMSKENNNKLNLAATVIRQKIMKTYKVTFFDKELEVVNVITFHNVVNQSEFLDNLAIQIVTLDLHESVKCEAEGKSYTQIVNELLKNRIDELRAA
jgi:hypothetical protein